MIFNHLLAYSAALLGFSSVLLGALGAHALDLGESTASFDTATRYQLIHALLILFFATHKNTVGAMLGILGCVFFCGSIYLKIFTGDASWARFAPIGGFSLMLAWLSACLIKPSSNAG